MLDSKFLLFYGWTFLIPWGVVHYLLKYVLDRKITGSRHQMPRPEIVNHTRTFGALFMAILIWFAIFSFVVEAFHRTGFFVFCLFFGLAILMFLSLIGIWQLKKWGVLLLALLVAGFTIVYVRIYLNDGVNSLCPTAVFLLGGGVVIELWKTVNKQK